MKAKKALGVLLAGLLAAGALAGCSSGTSNSSAPESGSDSQGSSTAESQAPAEVQMVDIWYYWETEKHQETLDRSLENTTTPRMRCRYRQNISPLPTLKSSCPSEPRGGASRPGNHRQPGPRLLRGHGNLRGYQRQGQRLGWDRPVL